MPNHAPALARRQSQVVVFSKTARVKPGSVRAPVMLRRARRYKVALLAASSRVVWRMPPPSVGTGRRRRAPPARGIAWRSARRSCLPALAAEWLPARFPPTPTDAPPNSGYGQSAGPVRQSNSSTALPFPTATSLVRAPFPVRSCASNDPAATPRLRSFPTPPHPPCPGPTAAARRCVCARR